jgi:hypothetical protein
VERAAAEQTMVMVWWRRQWQLLDAEALRKTSRIVFLYQDNATVHQSTLLLRVMSVAFSNVCSEIRDVRIFTFPFER